MPKYIETFKKGLLRTKIQALMKMEENCCICPRRCAVNRLKNKTGYCKTGLFAKAYNYTAHMGEEPVISGKNGSGAIFFSNCNMSCCYCQNYKFSQLNEGKEINKDTLRDMMLELQNKGCHNINLVTPTHVSAQALDALELAITKGLNIPLVYNSSGYELPEVIQILNGVVDIYLVDMRYADNKTAGKYSQAPNYPEYNQNSLLEMFKQAPIAKIKNNIMTEGIIIRHLILPEGASGTEKIAEFINKRLSKQIHISLMSQYFPFYNAKKNPEINRRITQKEYDQAKAVLEKYYLTNGWVQEESGLIDLAGVNLKKNV